MVYIRGDLGGARLVICLVFSLVILSSFSSALGVITHQPSRLVNEGETSCFDSYSVYSENEILVAVSFSEEFADYAGTIPDPVTVPAGSTSDTAVPIEVCFDMPSNVYSGSCGDEQMEIVGEIILIESSSVSGGSAAEFLYHKQFTLKPGCVPSSFNYMVLLIIAIVVIIIIIIIVLVLKKKKSSGMPMPTNTAPSTVPMNKKK